MSGVRWAQHHGAGRRPPGSGCRETDARGPARSAAAGRARCGHAAPRSAPPAAAEDGHKIQIISRPQPSAQLTSPCTSNDRDLWIYGE